MPRTVLVLLATCISTFTSGFALSRGTLLFLTITPSAQLNGTAGAVMSGSLLDPLTLMSNPAALGRAAEYSCVAGEFNPERTQWLPGFGLTDISYSSRALSFGANAGQLFDKRPSRFYVGAAYSEAFLDLGTTERRDQYNNPLGTAENWERVRGISIAGSYVRPVRLSFGVTFKQATSQLGVAGENGLTVAKANAFANDFGVIASLPKKWNQRQLVQPYLTPMIAYAMTNLGSSVRYTGQSKGDPLPRTARVSLSLAGGLDVSGAHDDWHILALEYAVQGQDELIAVDNHRGDYHYQWFTGDINVVEDLLLGQSNDRIEKQRGWEIGIADLFYVRGGSLEDVGEDWNYQTDGTGFRLHGLLQIIEHAAPGARSERVWRFLADRMDIVYSVSHWRQNPSPDSYGWSPIDGTTFRQISLFFR